MAATAEIRPGAIDERDLALIEQVLSRGSLPDEVSGLLAAVVEHLRAGNGVSVVPLHAELTTVEAAELVNVSRPHLIKLLEEGALKYRMVGTHRRLRLVDVLEYRDRQDAAASAALDELTRQAEELGLYED